MTRGDKMVCRASTLCDKEVVNISDGCRLGCVDDVEINVDDCKVIAIIVYGKYRMFGLLGRCDDIVICWEDIKLVGEDTILVSFKGGFPPQQRKKKKRGFFSSIFGG